MGATDAASPVPGLGSRLAGDAHGRCVYLDYNATTPIFPPVAAAMAPFVTTHFGNPSSSHAFATPCKEAMQLARAQVAALVNAEAEEILCVCVCVLTPLSTDSTTGVKVLTYVPRLSRSFTSCGTESDNWAIASAVAAAVARGDAAAGAVPHVVASAVEHPAVLEYLAAEQTAGKLTYTLAPVQPDGTVVVEDVLGCIKPGRTCLVTVMHSNNETGALQPIQELGARIAGKSPAAAQASTGCWSPFASRRRQRMGAVSAALAAGRVLFHTDAAQSCGKVPVDVRALGCDYLTIVGHKFGAPKGVAALFVRKGAPLCRYLYGGGQEHGFRAGTENVLHMVGLGAAADLARGEMPQLMAHMASLRDRLQAALLASKPLAEAGVQLRVHGPADDAQRLPNTLSIALRGVCAAKFLPSVGDALAASAGAACHTHDPAAPVVISGVLRAMGVPTVWAMGTLRLSVGRHTTQEDVDAAVRIIGTHAPKFKEA